MTARSIGGMAAAAVRFLDPNRERQRVWRDSHDVDTPKAKPWQRVLDGSREGWQSAKNALLRTCAEDITRQARDHATARRSGDNIDQRAADMRLRVGDDRVLAAYLEDYNLQNGELFTAQATVAARLGLLSPSSVNRALHRLQHHGYLDWVRRSRRVEEEGQPGWPRRQASSGYFFDWKAQMAPRVWARFWQLLVASLKRYGKAAIATGAALFTRFVAPLAGTSHRPRGAKRPGPRALRLRSAIRRAESTPGEQG